MVGGVFAAANTAVSGTAPYAGASAPAQLATSTDASYNWAGYVADAGDYSAVSASWVVPPVSANVPLAADATWVGIGGVGSQDLIQAGTQALVQDGSVHYEAWYEVLPQSSQAIPFIVSAGDSMSVALTYVGANKWEISFVDNTSGKRYSLDVAYESTFSSAEWIQEMPSMTRGSFIPLDDFQSLTFSGASAVKNGQAVTPAQAGAQPLKMITAVGDTLAEPSTISQSGGFTVVRSDAQVSASLFRGRRPRL